MEGVDSTGAMWLYGGIAKACQPRLDSSICPESQNLAVWGETPGSLEDMGVRWGGGDI